MKKASKISLVFFLCSLLSGCGGNADTVPEHTHFFLNTYAFDETGHWHPCQYCEEKEGFEAHTESEAYSRDEKQHYHLCTKCGAKLHIENHVFDQKVTTPEFLSLEATCQNKATYYYSCICGEKGTDTFEVGDLAAHEYDPEWHYDETNHYHQCLYCDYKKDIASHVYDQESVEPRFLKEAATCQHKAIYYKSCICGKVGTETFEYGEKEEHSYPEGYYYDENSHFKICIYGERGEEAKHNFSRPTILRMPDNDNPTVDLEMTCPDCGYTKQESVTPKEALRLLYSGEMELEGFDENCITLMKLAGLKKVYFYADAGVYYGREYTQNYYIQVRDDWGMLAKSGQEIDPKAGSYLECDLSQYFEGKGLNKISFYIDNYAKRGIAGSKLKVSKVVFTESTPTPEENRMLFAVRHEGTLHANGIDQNEMDFVRNSNATKLVGIYDAKATFGDTSKKDPEQHYTNYEFRIFAKTNADDWSKPIAVRTTSTEPEKLELPLTHMDSSTNLFVYLVFGVKADGTMDQFSAWGSLVTDLHLE